MIIGGEYPLDSATNSSGAERLKGFSVSTLLSGRIQKRNSRLLALPLLFSLVFSLTTLPIAQSSAANAVCATGAAQQNSIEVEPSHGKVLYIDTGVTPRIDGAYIGYRVTNKTGSNISGWWVALSNFTGGAVNLADVRDQYMQLPPIANNGTQTVYFLVKASISTKVAQTHTVKVFNGKPDVSASLQRYACDFSFTKVAETIKAAANKVTSVTVEGTAASGQLITVRVLGETGTVGAGSADVGKILWFSPSAFSNFPTSALRLESTTLRIYNSSNRQVSGANKVWTYSERLLVTPSITPSTGIIAGSETAADSLSTAQGNPDKRWYTNTYNFRVLGRTASSVTIQPIAQISSGTQIKHTDTAQAASKTSLDLTTVPTNLSVTKTIVEPADKIYASASCLSGTCNVVPYRIRLSASSGSVTVDEVVDTPASGVVYQSGSVAISSGTISPPELLTSESSLNPQPYHFIGPFTVTAGTNLDITYSMLVPQTANTTFSNSAVAYIGTQAVGASSSTVSTVNVTNSGDGTVGTVENTSTPIDPVATTFGATSIGPTSATLNGTVDANKGDGDTFTISAQFEWSTNSNLASYTVISASASVTGSSPTALTQNFTGTSGTTYYYRIVAIKDGVRYPGSIVQFTLTEEASPPIATTTVATNILSRSATLNGTIDPNLQSITEVRFIYGTASDLSGTVVTKILYELKDDGTEDTLTKVNLSGANPIDLTWEIAAGTLTTGTTYYYRIEGSYNDGTAKVVQGSILSFKPGTTAQTITFPPISDQVYSLNGTVTANATSSQSLPITYASETTEICTVDSSTGVITFLKSGFCLITASQNGSDTVSAAEPVSRQFEITPVAPTAETRAATDVTKTSATLNGALTTGGGASTVATFLYSTNETLTGATTVTAAQSPISVDGSVTYALTGLTANTTYYFKVVGQNSNSTVSGLTLNFTTLAAISVTVTAENKTKNYLGTTPEFTFTSSGLDSPDQISTVTFTFTSAGDTPSYGPSTTPPTEVGVYTITPSASIFSTGNSGDYAITYTAGSYTINKIDQEALVLSGASLSQNANWTLNATGGSGSGAVSYEIIAGGGTCTIEGSTLTSKSINETCKVRATKALDRNYNVQTTTADFVINSNLAQTITFSDPIDRLFDPSSFNHEASASSTLPVTLTSNSLTICTVATTDNPTIFAITMLKAGVCSLTASQAGGVVGDNTYNAADSVTQEFLINKASRTIVIKNNTEGDPFASSYNVSGYSSWGESPPTLKSEASKDDSDTKTYSIAPGSTGCTIAANGVVTFTGAGTCKATVSIAGNRFENRTSPEISFTIGKKNHLITFDALSPVTLGAADQILPESTNESQPITYTVNDPAICEIITVGGRQYVRAIALGTCNVTASSPASDNYNSAGAASNIFTRGFLISEAAKLNRTIEINNSEFSDGIWSIPNWAESAKTLTSAASDDDEDGSKTYSTSSSSSICTVDSSTGVVTFVGAGDCPVTVTIAPGASYNSASSTQTKLLRIGKRNQNITFNSPNNMTVGDSDQDLASTTDATGLSPTLTVDPSSVGICEIVSGRIRAIAAGTCRVNSSQSGNTNWNSASPVQRTFVINPRTITEDPNPPGPNITPPAPTPTPTPTPPAPVTPPTPAPAPTPTPAPAPAPTPTPTPTPAPTAQPQLVTPPAPAAPAILTPPAPPAPPAPGAPVTPPPAAPIFTPAPPAVTNIPTITAAPQETIIIREVAVQTTPTSYGVQISGQDWSIAITSTKQLVEGAVNAPTDKIAIEVGNTVTTFGTGFKPNSQVDVYIYSTATWLGSVITDDKGNYTVTLPMPLTLPVGDHTFQARGVTFDNLERTANVPITLVPASDAPALTTKASKKFEVFYAMNSATLDAKAKKVIRKAFTQVKSLLTSASTVKVQITGWVQPTNRSPRIQFLSTNRATAVRDYLKELGLKAKFTIAAPGHDKRNVPASRRASAIIEWSNAKK